MPVRLKKLIGTLAIVALVVVYAFIAMTVATYRLDGTPWWTQLAYFLFTGLLWVVPAIFLINWMQRPPKSRQDRRS